MEVLKKETPQEDAGKALTHTLRQNAHRPILLMLSGGSAFSILDSVDLTCIGPHVTITILDERFSFDLSINNFAQLAQTAFYKNAISNGAKTIAFTISDSETLESAGSRFESALHEWKSEHPDGVIIATMGIGPDGHTAGMFPGDFGVDFNGPDWVVAYAVPETVNQYTERISVTHTFLRNQVDTAIVYAVGPEKLHIINDIQNTDLNLETCPAKIITEMQSVRVFTSEEKS